MGLQVLVAAQVSGKYRGSMRRPAFARRTSASAAPALPTRRICSSNGPASPAVWMSRMTWRPPDSTVILAVVLRDCSQVINDEASTFPVPPAPSVTMSRSGIEPRSVSPTGPLQGRTLPHSHLPRRAIRRGLPAHHQARLRRGSARPFSPLPDGRSRCSRAGTTSVPTPGRDTHSAQAAIVPRKSPSVKQPAADQAPPQSCPGRPAWANLPKFPAHDRATATERPDLCADGRKAKTGARWLRARI